VRAWSGVDRIRLAVLLAVVGLALSGLTSTASAHAYDDGAQLDAGTTVSTVDLALRPIPTSGGVPGFVYDSPRYRCATNGAPRADFVVGSDGTAIPTSASRLEAGLQEAGFPSRPTVSPGVEYTLSDGSLVRIMQPSGQAPLRASFTNANGGPINPFTGKPPQLPPGLTAAQRRAWVRALTHIELQP